MPTYIAFLRAINLGSRRKLPRDAIVHATEAAGGTDVETHGNTGNVRLTHAGRSTSKVQAALERAYADAAGFEVPTIVFTATDLKELVARAEELNVEHTPAGQHYVTMYAAEPAAAAAQALAEVEHDEGAYVVEGRAAHALLDGDVHTARVTGSRQFKALGPGTARTIKVLRAVAEKWC